MRTLNKDEARKIWDALFSPGTPETSASRSEALEDHVANFQCNATHTADLVRFAVLSGSTSAVAVLLNMIADDAPGGWIERLIEVEVESYKECIDGGIPAEIPILRQKAAHMQASLDALRARRAVASITRRRRS